MLAQSIESLPRFISTLAAPIPPQDELARVPLAVTGRWVRGTREFSITRQDLEAIVHNFRGRQNGEINVDYDHASEMPEVAAGGPIPSAGRIVRMDAPEPLRDSGPDSRLPPGLTGGLPDSRFILYGWYEPTERARRLISNREYRYISPAIDWSARSKKNGKPVGATLSTVALTNRPFLEEMPPIRLSDPEYRLVEESRKAGPHARQDETRNSEIESRPADFKFQISNSEAPVSNAGGAMKKVQLSVVDGKIKVTHQDQEFFADPADLKACAEALGAGAQAEGGREPQPLSEGPTVNDGGERPPLVSCSVELCSMCGEHSSPLQQPETEIPLRRAGAFLSEAEAAGKSISAVEFFRGEVERELEAAVRTGRILPRRRDDWRKMALSDFPTFRRILADQKPQVPLGPVGFSGAAPQGAETQVKLLAEQRMRERRISFGQALSEIGREQPELAREYRRAVSSNE